MESENKSDVKVRKSSSPGCLGHFLSVMAIVIALVITLTILVVIGWMNPISNWFIDFMYDVSRAWYNGQQSVVS